MKPHKIFLIISIVTFGVGLLDLGESMFWHALRPVGAVAFLLFFIFQLLDKEVALMDKQEREKMDTFFGQTHPTTRPASTPRAPARSSRPLSTATSH